MCPLARGASSRKESRMRQRRRPSWFDEPGIYRTAHYIARHSATSAPSSAPAYSAVVVGALGGVIISQAARGGGGGKSPRHRQKRVASDSAPRDWGKRPDWVDFHCSPWVYWTGGHHFFGGEYSVDKPGRCETVCGPARGVISNAWRCVSGYLAIWMLWFVQLDVCVCVFLFFSFFFFASSLVALHLLHRLTRCTAANISLGEVRLFIHHCAFKLVGGVNKSSAPKHLTAHNATTLCCWASAALVSSKNDN